MKIGVNLETMRRLPEWVDAAVSRYLVHTEMGVSIRQIARAGECHASTVLRQVRRLETRRDDLLVDQALIRLSIQISQHKSNIRYKETRQMAEKQVQDDLPDTQTLANEGRRILRRLCENGAVLAIAADMEKAVVVRDLPDGGSTRTAVVDRPIAQAMALQDWIVCKTEGRISRYSITATGRTALNRLMAEEENKAQGFSETQAVFADAHLGEGLEAGPSRRPMRFNMADSPLSALARRRDRSGNPFLAPDLVSAGERLREDFELAQMGGRANKGWEKFLAGRDRDTYRPDPGLNDGAKAAQGRVAEALQELGEGLSDVALRCCCMLEGLETAEKRLGWSARSGKIVLRIALIRLSEYYRSQAGGAGRMIG